jgi:hypothetical protein
VTATCDRCGKVLVEGDMLYSIASKFDEETGQWVSGRHWHCHEDISVTLGKLRTEINKAGLHPRPGPVDVGLPPRRRP